MDKRLSLTEKYDKAPARGVVVLLMQRCPHPAEGVSMPRAGRSLGATGADLGLETSGWYETFVKQAGAA